jgi:hypothetical protein
MMAAVDSTAMPVVGWLLPQTGDFPVPVPVRQIPSASSYSLVSHSVRTSLYGNPQVNAQDVRTHGILDKRHTLSQICDFLK